MLPVATVQLPFPPTPSLSLSLSLCVTSPTGLKSFTATDNEMFYDFSMFTPSSHTPLPAPLARHALWQGQRQNYAHFQIHLNTRNCCCCCCCSGAWHAFKICSLQNVCPHRGREGEGERGGGRVAERLSWLGNNLFWVSALPTNFWHFISKFIFCTANMATLGLQTYTSPPISPTPPLLHTRTLFRSDIAWKNYFRH